MNKAKSIILLCLLGMFGLLITGFVGTKNENGYNGSDTFSATNSKNNVFFYSRVNNGVNDYIYQKKDDIAAIVRYDSDIDGEIVIGTPISVRSTAELYYVPVFYEDNCVHIVTVLQDGSTYSMSSGRMFADIINQLTPGYYYIEDDAESDVVYLKGDNLKIAIDGDFYPDYDNIGNSERTIMSERDEITVDMFGNGLYRVEDVAFRGQNSYSLSINTRFPNGGAYGYCWLCAACEISVYFGGSNVGLEAAHIEVHGPIYPPSGHTLYNCPGAMLPTDINTVVNHYAGKTASLSYSLTAYQTMQSIYSSQNPIYSNWKYYDGEDWHGHDMVIVGYVYITESGSFTYVLHDSNDISGNRYAYSTYSATSVTYPVGSNNYTWTYSMYNWN